VLIDSHAHLTTRAYADDRDEVLARCAQNGLVRMVEIGAVQSFDGNIGARLLADRNEMVYFTLGLHPHDAKDFDETRFAELCEIARTHDKAVGIGETGLDYFYDHSPHDVQREVFARHISAARDLNMPLVIHDRDAHVETMEILKAEGGLEGPGEFHCFSGDWELAKQVIDAGWFVALGGVVTFKAATDLHEVARRLPLEFLLLETDSPFLTPIPHRGKRNEPWYVKLVAERIGDLRGIRAEEVIEASGKNAVRLFGLGLAIPEAGEKRSKP
jgi:TatD DNase family protein